MFVRFEWFEVFILALPILLVMEIYKIVNNKLSGKQPSVKAIDS